MLKMPSDKSREKRRPKSELIGLWTRARALDALGRRNEAVADLKQALDHSRRLGDPALFLRLAAALLPIDGTTALANEAQTTVDRIAGQLLDEQMRHRFEAAEVVQLVRKLAAATS